MPPITPSRPTVPMSFTNPAPGRTTVPLNTSSSAIVDAYNVPGIPTGGTRPLVDAYNTAGVPIIKPAPIRRIGALSTKIAVPPRRLAMGAPVLVNPYANPNALTVSSLSNSAIAAAGGGSFSSAGYAAEVQEEPETVGPVSQEYKDYLKGKVVPLVLIVLALVVVGYLIFKKPWKKAA